MAYDLIFLEASKPDASYAHNLGGKDIHFIDDRNLIFNNVGVIRSYYKQLNREMPDKLQKIITDANSTYVTFPYYNGKGFGKRVGNGYLIEATEYLMELALSEPNKDIRALVGLYASFYIAKLYQPTNIVSLFDKRDYSNGDKNGNQYCVSRNGKLNNAGRLLNCNMTLATLWNNALTPPLNGIIVAKAAPFDINDVVAKTSNYARGMYTTQPFQGMSREYQIFVQQSLKAQAEKAGYALNYFWFELYNKG